MATTVVMPQMGYDMQEGTLVRWLKRDGEEVKRGESIAEIETDKAVVEMEAYASGVVLKTVVEEGSTVPVGQAIAFIGTPGEPLPDTAQAPETPAESDTGAEATATPEEAAPSEPAATSQVKASPMARRLAEEKGIDLTQVAGTGPGGRITRDDVMAHDPGAATTTPEAPPSYG